MSLAASLKDAVDIYLQRYPLPVLPQRASHIKRVITLDMWLPDGKIAHDYNDAIRLVEELADKGLAKDSLLYLPGWHAPYDLQYPAYMPSKALGGKKTFRHMLEIADQAGVTIMPHFNYWAYDVSSKVIKGYEAFQVRDHDGVPQGWAGILKTGYTNPLAYMRIDDPRWQSVFFEYLEPLLNDYPVKALFLDQIGCWAGNSEEFDTATLSILERLRNIKPDLLLGGEVLNDRLISHIDICQAWGQPWCGLEIDFTDSFSLIVSILFADKVRFISHLGLPCAKPCRYCWTNYPYIVDRGCLKAFEQAQQHNRRMGGIPHVRLAYNRWGIDDYSLKILSSSISNKI